MHRRRIPAGRFSWRKAARLQRVEAVLVGASLALIGAAVFGVMLESRTTSRLLAGSPVPATVVSSGDYNSLRLGRFATLSYAVDGRPYTASARYEGGRMTEGWTVLIRPDASDPRTFVVGESAYGSSLGLWLTGLAGMIAGAFGLTGLVVFAAAHQWRYD